MPKTINPLRYPGAKRSLTAYIEQLINANHLQGCTFFEPYAGSAVVGLELLQHKGIEQLVLCEKDILLYAFWKCLFFHTDDICKRIVDTTISVETWKKLIPLRNISAPNQADLVDLGFAGLFFNRTNFSGILNANPIGGLKQSSKYKIDCRFNKKKIIEIIEQLSKYREQIEVNYSDALEYMASQKNRFYKETCFAYFDPPYYNKGKLIYRHFYTEKDHKALADYVRSVTHLDWLISYDDAPYINELYNNSGLKYQPFFLDYSCASKIRSQGNELLISNLPLPPFRLAIAEGI